MSYPLLIVFALAPSVIWLLYFLRKDVHPESNRMVLKIFFFGMIAAALAAFLELGFFNKISELNISPFLASVLNIFIGIALAEELLKYLVVRIKVVNSPELDEPLDVMLYMIIAALGFVALENLLIFLSSGATLLGLGETVILASFRFVLATFLHALTSGILGLAMALSFFESKNKGLILAAGFFVATALHGLYNFSIMIMTGPLRLLLPVIIIVVLAYLVSLGFKKLKKIASVCKIN